MAEFYPKFDYTVPEEAKATIQGEAHTIPGAPHIIFLRHIPKEDDPSTVVIPGFTEVDGEPGPGEFRVFYGESGFGQVEFNPSDQGTPVTVDYVAAGSVIWAETYEGGNRQGINHLQEVVQGHIDDTQNPHGVTLEQARQAGDSFAGPVNVLGNALVNLGRIVFSDNVGSDQVFVLEEGAVTGTLALQLYDVVDGNLVFNSILCEITPEGDVILDLPGRGVILTAPDFNSRWRLRVNNSGDLVTEEIV